MTRKMFTIPEFAEHSNMSYKAAYTLVKKGGFHTQRSGHEFLIPANEVYGYMTKTNKLNKMLTVDEAAEHIGIKNKQLLHRIRTRALKAKKYGNKYLIAAEEVNRFMKLQSKQGMSIVDFANNVNSEPKAIYNLIRSGVLYAEQFGKKYYINSDEASVFEYVTQQRHNMTDKIKEKVIKYYSAKLAKYPDVFFIKDITEITGYSNKTVLELIHCLDISVTIIRCMQAISKDELIELLSSSQYQGMKIRNQIQIEDFRAIAKF